MEKRDPGPVSPDSEQRLDLRLADQADPARFTPRMREVLREVFHLDPPVPGGMVAPQIDALTAAGLGMFLGGLGAPCTARPVAGEDLTLSCPRCRQAQPRADRCPRCGLDIPGEGRARFARARSMLSPQPPRPVPGRGPDRPAAPARPEAAVASSARNRSWFVGERWRITFNILFSFGLAGAVMGWLAAKAFSGGYTKTGVVLALTAVVCVLPSLLDIVGLLSPRRHAVMRQLSRYGDVREVAEEIDRRRRSELFTFKNFQMAGPWVFGRKTLLVRIFQAREVVAMGVIPKGTKRRYSSGIYRVTETTIHFDRFCGLALFLEDGSTFDFYMGELSKSQYGQLIDVARRITALSGAELSLNVHDLTGRWNDPVQRRIMINEHLDRHRRQTS